MISVKKSKFPTTYPKSSSLGLTSLPVVKWMSIVSLQKDTSQSSGIYFFAKLCDNCKSQVQ